MMQVELAKSLVTSGVNRDDKVIIEQYTMYVIKVDVDSSFFQLVSVVKGYIFFTRSQFTEPQILVD